MRSLRHGALHAVDHLLFSMALCATALSHRRAWRLGQALASGARRAHAALRRVAQVTGCDRLDLDLVRSVQARTAKEPPPYPGFTLPGRFVTSLADTLLRGEYSTEDGRSGRVEDLQWLREPFPPGSRLSRLRFHALEWVEDLLLALHLTTEPQYLRAAKNLVERWMAECLEVESAEEVWSDHAVPLRALTLCRTWHAARQEEQPGSPFMATLLHAIVRHAIKLAHPRFYRFDHNHGVTQAYALLAVGLTLPALPLAPAWTAIGHRRLEAQMADNVSEDGVHREHSPYYQFYVLRHFLFARRLAEAHGVSLSSPFQARLSRMLAASAHLLKPDRTLPALGDTARGSPVLVDPDELSTSVDAEELLYSATGGRAGRAPLATNIALTGGGYIVLRSGWGSRDPFEHARYVIMRVATFRTAHVHRDLLGIEFYAYGTDILVDAGGPYAYDHPLRRTYFVATAAHNTVTVDGGSQALAVAEVLHWHSSGDWAAVVAAHNAYLGVRHRRALILLPPAVLLVIDRLDSDRPHVYEQTFLFNPRLHARLDGLELSARSVDAGPLARAVPLLADGLEATLECGTITPAAGWVTTGEWELHPAPALAYRRRGTSCTFATLVEATPSAATGSARVRLHGLPFAADVRVEVHRGDRVDVVHLSASGLVQLTQEAAPTQS